MTNSPYVRSALAQAALESVPPLIRETLLHEGSFRSDYGFITDAVLVFGASDVSIRRSRLFNAVRTVLGDDPVKTVTDMNGLEWKLKDVSEKGSLPSLALSRGDRKPICMPDFTVLSPDRDVRLRFLHEAVLDVNLPSSRSDRWRRIVAERHLEDDEVDAFHSEFRDTPVAWARSIRGEVARGKSSISSLVPASRRYFERLIGAYDGSVSIQDYSVGNGKILFDQLSSWKSYDGFLYSLFLSSHPSLTAEINVQCIEREELVRAFGYLNKHGDIMSQVGAIEIGLRIFARMPEIESILVSLVEQVRDDDVDGARSKCGLLLSLYCLVDGELSRTRLLADLPPYYRRLASLSHAALIHRELRGSRVDSSGFSEWAFTSRGGQYFLQSLTDMRNEPRWNANFWDASRIRANFCRRIIDAATNYEASIKDSELSDVIFSNTKDSLLSSNNLLVSYLPGPLEGREEAHLDVPPEIAQAIEIQLRAEEVGALSFISLVNSASIFRIGEDHAELAAVAIERGRHRLRNVEDGAQLFTIVHGLATVAAITRSHRLADQLRILVRTYRGDPKIHLSIHEAVTSCLVAGASHPDLNEWCEFVGEWLTELSFGDLSVEEGRRLHSFIRCLCDSIPELWVSCGRADAALLAYIGR